MSHRRRRVRRNPRRPGPVAVELAEAVMLWVRTPGPHGGNPHRYAFVKMAERILEDAGRTNPPETRDLVAAYIGDGYLYGASASPAAADPHYWLQLRLEDEPYELYHLRGVPFELAQHLELQGTSEQHFGDGYEASYAAAPYVDTDPFYEYVVEPEEEEEGWGEPTEPEGGDYVLFDTGRLGSRTGVSVVEGPSLGSFDTRDEAERAIRERMERESWYPDVWYRDDHGGLTLITLDRTNPPSDLEDAVAGELVGELVEIRYKHAGDGHYYKHKFGKGDELRAMGDGSLRVVNTHRKLWRDFP